MISVCNYFQYCVYNIPINFFIFRVWSWPIFRALGWSQRGNFATNSIPDSLEISKGFNLKFLWLRLGSFYSLKFSTRLYLFFHLFFHKVNSMEVASHGFFNDQRIQIHATFLSHQSYKCIFTWLNSCSAEILRCIKVQIFILTKWTL